MKRILDECCDCATENYPCLGRNCPRKKVTRFYCDECREEGILYHYAGEELCVSCLLNRFDVVEGSV